MKYILVFDGKRNEYKCYEDIRRRDKRDSAAARVAAAREAVGGEVQAKDLQAMVAVTSTVIALAVKVCRDMGVKFIVAPGEADGQLAAQSEGDLVVSADGDMLALGVVRWVSVSPGGWFSGAATMVDTAAFTGEHAASHPLVGLIRDNGPGPALVVAYAGLRGCDFSELPSGILGVGFNAAVEALKGAASDLTPSGLIAQLEGQNLPQMPEPYREEMLQKGGGGEKELERVFNAYRDATYYDQGGRICLVSTGAVVAEATEEQKLHMGGKRDPKTGGVFDVETQAALDDLKTSELTLAAEPDPSTVPNATLPKPIMQCLAQDLKAFISVRGGKVSGLKLDELRGVVQDYLELEKLVPAVLIVRERSGLMLKHVDSKLSKPMHIFVDRMLAAPETGNVVGLKLLLDDVKNAYRADSVITEMDLLCLQSPEINSDVIDLLYSSLGASDTKKSIQDSFSKSSEQTTLVYHAYVKVSTTKHILITKQNASLTKDETTRKDTPDGEKPLAQQYPCILELEVVPTTENDDGHTLGKVVRVRYSWCRCKAGAGACVHKGMALWNQIHVWSPARPMERSATQGAKGWGKGQGRESFA